MSEIKPVVLVILDGFGISPVTEGNAIYNARTPIFDDIIKNYPTVLLHASGQEVGLEFGEIGNSEVGHLNLGTGRVIMQDLPRIDLAIESKTFFENTEMKEACKLVKKNQSTLHLIGLASNGGVHSHINHLFAIMELAKKEKVSSVAIHVITDGRDTPPKKANDFIKKINEKIKSLKIGKIASVVGRFYAMDRDRHWSDRTKIAYDLWTKGLGNEYESAEAAVDEKYKNGETDENLSPIIIDKNLIIKDADAVIFYNFRIDRTKQIAKAIIDPNFDDFSRDKILKNLFFVSFTNYGFEPTKNVRIAFFSDKIKNCLAETLNLNNLSHLHVAETEKYAHVTYFFNGGIERPFSREERLLIPSLRISSYELKPEMSAKEICKNFIPYFQKRLPNFTVLNFANPDMVGHTGNYRATVKGVETVDIYLGKIISMLEKYDARVVVTADHGNAEQMINPETGEIDKEHTTNPVPFVIISGEKKETGLDKMTLTTQQPVAVLADVAPTVMSFLEVKQPKEMNGQNLRDII